MTTSRIPAYRAIADSILEDILARRLLPGDRLPSESELAERFGVSRPTVREALRDISSQHLVETTRGATGGTFVVVPSTDNLVQSLSVGIELLAGSSELTVAEMLEARELLEVPATRLAANRATADQHDLIETYLATEMGATSEGAELMSNWTFHSLVMRAANNPMLALMSEPIFHVLQTRFASNRASAEFRRQVRKDHETIGVAILAGDETAAAAAMLSHLEHLRPIYRAFDTRLGRP